MNQRNLERLTTFEKGPDERNQAVFCKIMIFRDYMAGERQRRKQDDL